jgi:hypothetical protein
VRDLIALRRPAPIDGPGVRPVACRTAGGDENVRFALDQMRDRKRIPRAPTPPERTFQTPSLSAELGLSYVLDWTNDDQPYALTVPGVISVPYSVELDDLLLVAEGLTGPDGVQIVKDQYEQLRADSEQSGRVMALALRPFVIGQPFRHKYLDQVLEYLAAQPDIWLTTSDDIAEHFRRLD